MGEGDGVVLVSGATFGRETEPLANWRYSNNV